jgi:GNAT superfamily N-acetyltransferase
MDGPVVMSSIHVGPGSLEEVLAVYPLVPELVAPHGRAEYERRLGDAPAHLILVARDQGQPVGFKVGYQRETDGSFYSWMGGVAHTHRRLGIAQQLAHEMENWARAQGYRTIKCTTLNRHRAMLLFALGNGFQIYAVKPMPDLEEYRIRLVKEL